MKCIICGNIKFSRSFKKFGYQIAQCKVCHFILTNPSPDSHQLNIYYKKFGYKIGFNNEYLIRQDSIRTLKNLKKLGYDAGLLLDIGCGAGFFLDEAREFGWEVRGVDTSEITTNYGKNKLKLKIIRTNFLNYKFSKSKFRVITLIQVIEHLANPNPLIKKIGQIIKKGGILYIATPNIESNLAKVLKKDFNYMTPPEHIAFYSPKTLERLLLNNGFKVIKINTISCSFDFASIVKHFIKRTVLLKDDEKSEGRITVGIKNPSIGSILLNSLISPLFSSLMNINHGGSIVEIYARR